MPKLFTLHCCILLAIFLGPMPLSSAAVSNTNQDVWRVDLYSVAHQPDCGKNFSRLKFFRWEEKRWRLSDAETFFDTQNPDIPLIVFTPGYRSSTSQTTRLGFGILRYFDPNEPCRIVFWDWFADQGGGGIRCDIRAKLPIVNNTAKYLAMFVLKVKPNSKICLFGFSFGSRIICRMLESLQNCENVPDKLRLRIVLSGAAADEHWFSRGQRLGRLPDFVEKILVTYNPSDWALRFYPLMYNFRNRAKALGFEGLPMRYIAPEFRNRFENVNVNRYIGGEHQTLLHVKTPVFRKRIAEYFFFK